MAVQLVNPYSSLPASSSSLWLSTSADGAFDLRLLTLSYIGGELDISGDVGVFAGSPYAVQSDNPYPVPAKG